MCRQVDSHAEAARHLMCRRYAQHSHLVGWPRKDRLSCSVSCNASVGTTLSWSDAYEPSSKICDVGSPFQGGVRERNVAGTKPASPSQSPQIVILRGVSSLSRRTSAGASRPSRPSLTLHLVPCVDDLDRPQPWRPTSSFECPPFARGTSLGEGKDFAPRVCKKCLQAVHPDIAAIAQLAFP